MKRFVLRAAALAAVLAAIPLAHAWATGQVVLGTASVNLNFNETKTSGVVTPQTLPVLVSANVRYANGTAAGQVDTIFAAQYSVASGTPLTVNLQSCTDLAGNTVTFARVREFIVQVTDATAGHTLQVYAAASNGWSVLPPSGSAIVVQPGGSSVFHLSDPSSSGSGVGNVVTSTSNSFAVNSNTSATVSSVNVLVVGCSAP